MMKHKLLIITYLFTVAISFICLRIEWLNNQAGGILPNREYRNGDPSQGSVTWRESLIASEKAWRIFKLRKDKNRKLTADEQVEMERDIAHGRANNNLLFFVSSFGLMQYLLMPVTLILGLMLFFKRRKSKKNIWIAIPPVILSLLCWAFAFFRGYFSSLGR